MARLFPFAAFASIAALPMPAAAMSPAVPPTASRADQVAALRGALDNAHSATAVLDDWCTTHFAMPAGSVVAEKLTGAPPPADTALRHLLQVGDTDPLVYRHVRLRCDGRLLSEAELWYVPARLPAAINRRLEETDTPFGRAAAPLDYRRNALPRRPRQAAPDDLFEERAVLSLPDGQPIAYVHEVYKSGLLP